MNYDFTVRIKNTNTGCQIDHFIVWDRFGTRQVTLAEKISNC
jgi:hypothetical protein